MRLHEIRTFGVFQVIVLILSFYAFGALIADTFFDLGPEASHLIQMFDYVVCAAALPTWHARRVWIQTPF